jgi:hypothetical protein
MNPQQIPGPKGEHQVFETINGKEMRWSDQRGLTHVVVGADIHQGVRVLWTLCDRDVPGGKAWLLEPGDAHELCMTCMRRMNDHKAAKAA